MEQSEWDVRKELVTVKRAFLAAQRVTARMQEQLFNFMERDIAAEDARLGDKWSPPAPTVPTLVVMTEPPKVDA